MNDPQHSALLQRRDAVLPRGVARLNDVVATRARGAIVTDHDGRELIDFATGIGVMVLGHGHPEVIAATKAQLDQMQHLCIHVATYEPYVALCEALARRFPHGDATKVMLVNSGAEAVENAVKIARQATGRSAVICFTGGFHGRTLLGLSLTSSVGYKLGCGPYATELYRLPYPDRRAARELSEAALVARELSRLRHAFKNTVPADQVAAIILEVVQGEGGFVPCPDGYLQGLRQICDEHGIVLICDEVQTGFGRTGRWAAYEHAGVTPDISTWAKAMGGGLPISAVIGKAEVMDGARPGTLGGTYGGNPVACASALASLKIMESVDIPAKAAALGERMSARLRAMAERATVVSDVRGRGAMLAFEISEDGDPDRPSPESTKRIIEHCIADGVLVIAAAGNNIRLLPPLTIDDATLDRGLDVIETHVLAVGGAR